MEDRRCLMAIHAHPDDESSKGSGTMALYASQGVRVVLVCATGGEEGDILNPRLDKPGIKDNMAELRAAELQTACDLLGVEEVYLLGYRDSGMPGSPGNENPEAFMNADPEEAVGKIVALIRKERPQVILSYDESKGYEHPDHVKVYEWGMRAWRDAADPNMFPEAGEPWAADKLYFFATFTRKRLEVLHQATIEGGKESPFAGWLDHWETMGFTEPEITTQIDVSDFVEVRSKALLAHATQIDPDSFWFAVPDDVQRKIYPWEDYTLVESRVPTELPEDDLFAGTGNSVNR